MLERLREAARGGRFVNVIEFPREHLIKFVDQHGWPVGAQFRYQALERFREPAEQFHIEFDDLIDAGPLHFDHQIGSIVTARGIHLANGSARQRGLLD